jgi:broad specificity phosphatase PhoE
MPLIYLVRHGETYVNAEKRINDENVITKLTDNGKTQAKKTGEYFKKKSDKLEYIIYTSPAVRTRQTTEIIVKNLNYKPRIIEDNRLIEMNYGKLSGLCKTDKLYVEFSKWVTDHYRDPIEYALNFDKYDKILSDKYGIEQTKNAISRVRDFFDSIINTDNPIIIVTHGGIVQCILSALFNIRVPLSGDVSNGKNCTITCIAKNLTKGIQYELLSLPNTNHLK